MPGSIPAAVDDPVAGASVRTVGKTSPINPLQFVKVQSPLYIKAEQQIKLTKEVKISREALKEGEEEWQSNLDDWKSRRRKVSEKVIQRAEEMRQIEAEEQLRKDKVHRKIKKFSEIVEKKCSRSYHLDMYMGGGDDSGLGATPEPDTSEEDTHKIPEKEPPKVPQKPFVKFKRSSSNNFHPPKVLDLNSSTEPSDIEGHAADTEATSSEEDVGPVAEDFGTEEAWKKDGVSHNQLSNRCNQSFKICIKHGDTRGFGFTLKGGKDQGCPAYIENVVKGSPAEEVGLKNGDKIISINGELTDEYSHSSLVFSVKQALYTGILDIAIKRSENCDIVNCETKTTESRKGKSFAEKLAIFTAGVVAPSVDTKSKSDETKTESLVLRRRSAFENGNADNGNFVNRRLSCISQPPSTSSEKPLEKRHSVDFALGQYVIPDNTSNKKGPPPPVPAKPKFKTKTTFSELNKSVLKANETLSSPSCSAETNSSGSPKEFQPLDFVSSESEHQQTITDTKPASENYANFNFDRTSSFSEYEASEKISYETELLLSMEGLNPNDCEFEPTGSNVTDEHSASFEVNALEVNETICNVNFFEMIDEMAPKEFGEELCNDSFEQESDTIGVTDTFSNQLTNGVSSEHFDQRHSAEDPKDSLDNYAESFSEEINAEVTSIPSACHSAICIEDNDEDPVTQEGEDSDASDYKNDDANASLLCLSLEKIDEDDVISASTTTSSDTPDTETVIETLPSNVSPLPNDESNSEDFSKVLSASDEKPSGTSSSTLLPSDETNDEQLTSQNYVETSEDYSSSVAHDSYYDDQQNEDYAHELDESLDQITSLDIIDRIEQSLMDQLQKEDSYEDPWLYYSEEDLTPRNLEPPAEPPPPPPPPENDNKVMPISRTNSTKRIKKELLRRRSDFLGLQSPEVSHVDSIPPPPPLLEDLLKEQTQWLENRSESPIGTSSESSYFVSSSYANNDYSEYFVESPKENEPEQWKCNMVEESVLDGNYGLHNKPDSETVIGNAKQCESPQHKAKQNIQTLGAAPKAKIMGSTQWITDVTSKLVQEVAEPQISCHLNGSRTSRRYSMPSTPPDVAVRTWGDRAYDYVQPRPTSATYSRSSIDNKDRHSLDLSYEAESEVHLCSCCGKSLCEGSAMGIEALRLYFHIECFRCCFCSIPLGNGSCGTDVQVKNNQLYCPSCFTVD